MATGYRASPLPFNHPACLRECGLVVGEQKGNVVRYILSDACVSVLLTHTNVALRAETPNRYAYYCTLPRHRQVGMAGVLVVEAG